jgi:hypothetical protein
MRSSHRFVVVLVLLLAASTAWATQDTLRKYWRRFSRAPIPAEWQSSAPPRDRDVASFEKFAFPRSSIRAVIDRFGTPDRYLVSRRENFDFLIYDLPSGHSVVMYVTHHRLDQWVAAVIIDSHGKLIYLDKG